MFVLADGHCDTLTAAKAQGRGLLDFNGHLNIRKLAAYETPLQVFAIWYKNAGESTFFLQAMDCIGFFYRELARNENYIAAAFSGDDITRNMREKKISGLLSLEGGEALEGNLANIGRFYQLGVRAIGLTWNNANALGDGVMVPQAGGLTKFGLAAVREMNRLGIAVDVSHLSGKGFWDVYDVSERPFVASHSNCYSICPHPRNLRDEQIKGIAERGGMIGLNLYPGFLCVGQEAGIEDILRHVERILMVGGDDCIGLGCDFDGIEKTPDGICDASEVGILINELTRCFGKGLARKIAGTNWLAFWKRELPGHSSPLQGINSAKGTMQADGQQLVTG